MRSMLAALALISAGAMAQTAPGYDTPPNPTERFKQCAPQDQAYFVRQEFAGAVVLVYRVTAEGRTDGLVVAASSGERHLDDGAIECAREWRYSPAMKGGAAVDTMWSAGLNFDYHWRDERERAPQPTLRPASNIDSCVLTPRPDAAALEGKPAVSVVRYRTKAGAVSEVRLKTSSGVRDLDDRAVACVKGWAFADKLSDGKPATGDWSAVIDWREGVPLNMSSAEVMAAIPCDFADANGCRTSPAPNQMGGLQELCAGFAEDKRLRVMAHGFAVDAMKIAAEHGITLSWKDTSLPQLEEILDVLAAEGDHAKAYEYATLFGSYLAHISEHRGVFGYSTIDGHKVPTLQTWRGCARSWPWAKVLKRLTGGKSGDITAYYRAQEAALYRWGEQPH